MRTKRTQTCHIIIVITVIVITSRGSADDGTMHVMEHVLHSLTDSSPPVMTAPAA